MVGIFNFHVLVADLDLSAIAVHRDSAGNDFHQRALACAVRAYRRVDFAGAQQEVHAFEDGISRKAFVNAAHFQNIVGFHRLSASRSKGLGRLRTPQT